ncbi:hypothetical protein quinque_006553 [Culex quinquefasciatus]
MADLEAVLADVSYLMAMEKSKCMPAARASKKIILPDPSSGGHKAKDTQLATGRGPVPSGSSQRPMVVAPTDIGHVTTTDNET